jgi:transketolase C-terminal domain/subunit
MKRIGVRDQFTESGPYLDILRKYGLTYEYIEDAARQVLARKG